MRANLFTLKVKVQYSCICTGGRRRQVSVRARKDGEDIVQWMHRAVTPDVSRDHRIRSPHCSERKLNELLLPMTSKDKVGEVEKH